MRLPHDKSILIILVLALVLHLVFLPGFHEIWWDSGVYAGMGKHIFSAGESGLWEHIRPPVWPLFLGFLWVLKLDMIFFGRILQLLFSLGCVLLFYLVARRFCDERASVISAVIFAFSSIFFYSGFHLYSEIPALFFVLLSIYLFVLKHFYFAGLFSALAFLTKFPAGMFVAVLGIVLLANRDFKNILKVAAGFIIPVAPVIVIYQIYYGNPLVPFIAARETILSVLGCNVLRHQPWWHYFYLVVTENFLHLFAVVGIIAYIKEFRKSRLLPLLVLAFPLVYFSQLNCRDYRYLVVFIPFVAFFTGYGISQIVKKSDRIFYAFLIAVLGISLFNCALFYISNENTVYDSASMNYFKYLEGRKMTGEVWSSNPIVSFFTDARINKIYYPVYDAGVSTTFNQYLKKKSGSIGYVLLDNCGGGIICAKEDAVCEEQTASMIDFLNDNFKKVYEKKKGGCWYRIFKA